MEVCTASPLISSPFDKADIAGAFLFARQRLQELDQLRHGERRRACRRVLHPIAVLVDEPPAIAHLRLLGGVAVLAGERGDSASPSLATGASEPHGEGGGVFRMLEAPHG
jgi:hypothetical protein